MKRLCVAVLLAVLPIGPSFGLRPGLPWGLAGALAQDADPSVKEAFEAARQLGTLSAWEAFLARYPTGFYADLARAYITKLAEADGGPPSSAAGSAPKAGPPPSAGRPTPPPGPAPTATTEGPGGELPPTDPGKPAVARGGRYMGFYEKFNRYYTDPLWKPSTTVFVSPNGRGNGSRRETPTSAKAAVDGAKPGTMIYFLRGAYQGCFELSKETGGTYDDPVVLYGERNEDKTLGVKMTCCGTGRQTCFNLEGADYVAVDGFELKGGRYGVRAIGLGLDATQHSVGVAVIDCNGHDQDRDPFFSGQADWAVWERNVGSGAKKDDGHGIYISNGSDWNIVRFNETFGGMSSDFQINADPNFACKEEGIAFDDPRCDAYAGEGNGGRGASDYFLVDGNFFHHSLGSGANFTSVRRSVIRNNIFGPQARHGVSFWQETDNPKLGSSDNKVLHNLFITTGRHGVKFEVNSTRNLFANNVLVGVQGPGVANPGALLMDVDDTVGDNQYRQNQYLSGRLEGRDPNQRETARPDFSAGWFARFTTGMNHDPGAFTPAAGSPLVAKGTLLPAAPSDRFGRPRSDPVDLGPITGP